MPSRAQMAASGMGGCVPSATITSNRAHAAPIRAWSARKNTSTGAVRVASGTISSTFLPWYSPGEQARATRSAASSRLTLPEGWVTERTGEDMGEEMAGGTSGQMARGFS